MHTPEIQMPKAGRRRTRYSDRFKRDVISACREPDVSVAAIALANRLNANMVRRWIVQSLRGSGAELATVPTSAPVQTGPAFIPVKFDPSPAVPQADIRIELQHGTTGVHIHWPISASSQCAQWLREVLA